MNTKHQIVASAKYQMMFQGAMRPVVSMWIGDKQTFDPMKASAVVLYVADDNWIATTISNPADIVLAPRPPTSEGRDWKMIR